MESYEQGLTPNPCIDCNRTMKFDKLFARAQALGCRYVVTGHYARIEEQDGKYFLKKVRNPEKDQSYVLYDMTQEKLAHTLFPLGNMTKDKVREMAAANGFTNAGKPDSQDICFVPDGDYAKVIEQYTGRHSIPGNFVLRDGTIVGQHEVRFLGDDEEISIRHEAYSKQVFASGALKAAQFLLSKKNGLYSMEDLVSELL